MNYVIGFGGIAGTYLLAYALFGAEHMFPRWRRLVIGLVGAALVAVFWIARPVIWPKEGDKPISEPCYAHGAEWDC